MTQTATSIAYLGISLYVFSFFHDYNKETSAASLMKNGISKDLAEKKRSLKIVFCYLLQLMRV